MMRGRSLRPRRVAVTLLALCLAAAAAAGCSKKDDPETTSSGVKLVENDKLTVCTNMPYPPFEFEESGGKIVGFDIDMLDLVAKKLNVEQKIVNTPFEGIRTGQDLNTGKCDVAAAAMTIKPDRQAVMDFSEPYFDATQALMVLTGQTYKSLDDLKGKRVGVQTDTTGMEYVEKQNTDKGLGITVVKFQDYGAQEAALKNRQIEAAVNDLPVFGYQSKQEPGAFEIVTEFNTGEQYGYAVKKGDNPELLKTINETITKSKQDGAYNAIFEKWIGRQPSGS